LPECVMYITYLSILSYSQLIKNIVKILSPFPLCPRFIVKIRKSRDPRLFVGTRIVVISRRDNQTLILRG
jgi:hypothetical protein